MLKATGKLDSTAQPDPIMLTNLDINHPEATPSYSSLANEVQTLKGQIQEINNEVRTLKDKNNQLKNEIAELKEENSELKKEINNLKVDNQILQTVLVINGVKVPLRDLPKQVGYKPESFMISILRERVSSFY